MEIADALRAGRLQRVAQSRDEFCAKIDEPGVADDWLMIPIVDQLVASGAVLGPGQCYSFRQLPVLGGAYSADNRMVFPIREHFGALGFSPAPDFRFARWITRCH